MKKQHKNHLYIQAGILALLIIFLQACQKEQLDPRTSKIVNVTFTGTSSVPLEFIYNNRVIDSTKGTLNAIPLPFTLNIMVGDQKVYVREKGKTEILRAYEIDVKVFEQQFGLLYEDGKLYDNSISYNLMINPMGKDVEIFIDGKLKDKSSYSSPLMSKLTIPVNKEQTRSLTVKIKGEQEVILARSITMADSNKTLKFLLQDKKPVENMTLPALKNPKAMSMTFILRPHVEFGQTEFLGGDVDLVFYLHDLTTEEITLPSPALHVSVPQGASFVTIELPPIPDSKMYTFDIFKKGTKEVAYRSTNPGYTVQPGLGKYGGVLFFKDLELSMFLPGERLVCTLAIAEEFGGTNFDEIYMVPGALSILNDFVDIAK